MTEAGQNAQPVRPAAETRDAQTPKDLAKLVRKTEKKLKQVCWSGFFWSALTMKSSVCSSAIIVNLLLLLFRFALKLNS